MFKWAFEYDQSIDGWDISSLKNSELIFGDDDEEPYY